MDPAPEQAGSIAVTVAGLPAGRSGSLTLTGPGGVSRSVTTSTTVGGLSPGSYTLAASGVVIDGDSYGVAPAVQSITVRAALATAATATYAIETGRLAVTVAGVTEGFADIIVEGPDGVVRSMTGSGTLKGLPAGSYVVAARPVIVADERYASPAASAAVLVSPGIDPSLTVVQYQLASGRLDLRIEGAPAGAVPTIAIDGPDGFSLAVTESRVLKGLAPGEYRLTGNDLAADGHRYEAVMLPDVATVSAGAPAVPVTASYRIATGALAITVTGLPAGSPGAVTVTGPGSYLRTVTATETLRGLAPGSYAIAAAAVAAGGSYLPSPTSQTVAVTASTQPVARSVTYSQGVGSLALTVGGLPAGASAAVVVSGPAGFSQPMTGSGSLTGLVPGPYTIAATPVSTGGGTYAPTPASQTVAVTAGATATGSVSYAGSVGASLTITINGLPGGTAANVTVDGPGGFSEAVAATRTLTGLAPGNYWVYASNVFVGVVNHLGSPAFQSATVAAGTNAVATVNYVATGRLAVTIAGLPSGASSSVLVTGPGGFSTMLTESIILNSLTAGTYTVTASSVMSGAVPYNPAPVSQAIAVPGGVTTPATVTYTIGLASALNLTIDGMYLTQATAKYDGTTPVITGRNAYLRVFVKANQANTATPSVRVRFYSGATLVQTSTIAAPGASVPTAVNEGSLSSSWNLAVPGSLVQPNLRILADVDPTAAVAESNESDNTFPASGTPFALDVRTVPTWNVRLVPVLQQATGLQGGVTAGNASQYLSESLKLLPVATYDANVRTPYTTTAPALQAGDANGAWGTILLEILTLRSIDASQRYYYGVVKPPYGSGVAGMGYVGGGSPAAIGWDDLPSGSTVMAHEVGHNMGLDHSPCGVADGPDPAYPYPGGAIGVYGLDLATMAVKAPAEFDFMGYCNPRWVSEYTWSKLIGYRQSNPNYAPPAPSNVTAGLLVWGRITSKGVALEPAIRVGPPATRPAGSGAYRVEGFAADGRRLFSHPVEVRRATVLNAHELHFSSVLPLDQVADQALVRIRLVTPAGPVERTSRQPVLADGSPLLLRDPRLTLAVPNAEQARLTWDAGVYPMALVRDAVTGEVLSFARGGAATLWTRGRQFDVTLTDGVRSHVRRLR